MKITDAFLGEHAVFYAQFDECETLLDHGNLEVLKQAAAVIASALESHAQLEDRLLFGRLAAQSDDTGIFQLMEEEHVVIAGFLHAIAAARNAGRASELLGEMIAAARAHFLKEESVAFPRAEQSLSLEQLQRLGMEWAVARGVEFPHDPMVSGRRNAPGLFGAAILPDLNLPRLTGHEVLAEITDDVELSQIPVIVPTTSEAEQDVVAADGKRANAGPVQEL